MKRCVSYMAGLFALTACGAKAGQIDSAAMDHEGVRITQLATVPERGHTSFSSAQERFANLDFELLSHPDLPPHVKAFIEAVRAIVEGQPDALARIDALVDAENDQVRALARQIRTQLHYDAGTFQEMRAQLVAWGQTPDSYVDILATLPLPRFESAAPTCHQLTRGAFDLPTLELEANGTRQTWLWDTGADFTLLPESLARQLGVTMDETEISMGTSTRQDATTRFGVLQRLDIGGVTIYDSAVLVLPDEGLRWETPDGDVLSIEGVLGWNVIRQVRTVLDFPGGRYSMELSQPREVPERNFFWLGYPIVRLLGPEGEPLAFGYDSGSGTTDLKPNYSTKLPYGKVRRRRIGTGGAAGIEIRRTRIVDVVTVLISGHRFDIPEVPVVKNGTADDTPFIELDGVLGSDIARSCTVTLDPPNGFYGMDCPEP